LDGKKCSCKVAHMMKQATCNQPKNSWGMCAA